MSPFLKVLISVTMLALFATATVIAAGGNKAQIKVLGDFYDFGYVPMDYKVVHIYQVKNEGAAELNIDKAITNCDCSSAIVLNKTIAPDSTGRIKVIFDTKQYYGKNTRNVTVHSNDAANPTVVMNYSSDIGVIPREFHTEPQSLLFLPGHKPRDVKLFNLTGETVSYEIEMEIDSIFVLNETAGKIKKGSTASVKVTPADNLPRGTHYSNFTVSYKTDPETRVTVPVKIVRY